MEYQLGNKTITALVLLAMLYEVFTLRYDYPTINQPNKFCRSINLGDPIAILGSIDFVSGSVDLKVNLSSYFHLRSAGINSFFGLF